MAPKGHSAANVLSRNQLSSSTRGRKRPTGVAKTLRTSKVMNSKSGRQRHSNPDTPYLPSPTSPEGFSKERLPSLPTQRRSVRLIERDFILDTTIDPLNGVAVTSKQPRAAERTRMALPTPESTADRPGKSNTRFPGHLESRLSENDQIHSTSRSHGADTTERLQQISPDGSLADEAVSILGPNRVGIRGEPKPSAQAGKSAVSGTSTLKRGLDDTTPTLRKRNRTTGPIPAPTVFPRKPVPFKANAQCEETSKSALADTLFCEIRNKERILSIPEVSGLLCRLQEKAYEIAYKHFGFKLNSEEQEAWPMHDLYRKYRPLKLVTEHIADGSYKSWQSFFTKPRNRVPLVHGILGELIKERIFKHTAFSLDEKTVEAMENMDRENIAYDTFPKNIAKGEFLCEALREKDRQDQDVIERTKKEKLEPPLRVREMETLHACAQLVEHIMDVLHPLLPPTIFPGPPSPFLLSRREKECIAEHKFQIASDLMELLRDATALHIGMRLAGRNGTVFRFVPPVARDTVYHAGMPMLVINGSHLKKTKPEAPRQAKMGIKMTTWCRCEAVVPHGKHAKQNLPDMTAQRKTTEGSVTGRKTRHGKDEVEMKPIIKRERDASRSISAARREKLSSKDQPLLPFALQNECGKILLQDQIPEPGTEWQHEISRAEFQAEQNESLGAVSPPPTTAPSLPRLGKPVVKDPPKRGAYVTFYNKLCPATVFCEWDTYSSANDAHAERPPRQSLDAAVHEARIERGGLGCWFESARVMMYNGLWARNGHMLEWAGVFGAAALGIAIVNEARHARTLESAVPELLQVARQSVQKVDVGSLMVGVLDAATVAARAGQSAVMSVWMAPRRNRVERLVTVAEPVQCTTMKDGSVNCATMTMTKVGGGK